MKILITWCVALCASTLLSIPSLSQQTQAFKSGYVNVNGLKMYYETHGQGEPMILLHGAYQSIDKMFRNVIAKYAGSRQVIAFEFQGHGRTADIDRDITYENLATDAYHLLEHLKIDSADVFAFSMGSNVGIQLAIQHPEKVKKMVLISGAYSHEGYQPSYTAIVPSLTPSMFEGSTFKKEYDSLSPRPDKFPVLVARMKKLDLAPFNWEKAYVKIKNPMFLIYADNDVVTLSHVNDMVTKVGGNVMGDMDPWPRVRLAVVPNCSHVGLMTRFKSIYPMIDEFLQQGKR
ncbi:alpha/beta fold hydrolase [Pseudochryseolinea flava]|uniref:Alpha/beta hydrolase n=1 Tax=Pseudochryseolinea flava TaxID=2059302 RepID=A0A364Y4L3_9BACT|nr:alpha/beta hydrolase [Pseudochryseolinea flava]RAW00745.1 alpha/beta hydrolase [Pseudochryseolinea flava]